MPASIKKVITSSSSITVARIVTTLCSLVTVPLLLSALGQQEYGLWILLLSLTGYFGLTNLGITYSLKNKVAYLFAEEKHSEINNFISACFLFYSFLFMLILGIIYALLFTNLFPFSFLISKDIVLVDKATIVFGIVITYFLFNLFVAGIISNVFHGFQEISRLSIFNSIYSVLSSAVFIVFLLFRPSLIGIALFQGFSTIVPAIILYLILKRRFGWLKVSLSLSNLKYMKAIRMTSFYFLTGSILATVITSIDNIVISHYVGLASVFIYTVSFRLFFYASSLFPVATASWPIISAMHQKKQYAELGDFYSKVLRLNVLTKVPIFIAAAVFSREIVSIWIGAENFYGYWLVAIFLFTWILWVWNGSNMVFVNAMSLHKLVQLPLFFEAAINLTISILLVKYTPLGLIGIALGTLIGQALVAVYFVPRILSRQLDIKPFSEVFRTVIPLLLPALILIGFKLLIDFTIALTLLKYGLYIAGLGIYLVLLYSTVLKAPERQIIKEKIPQFMHLGKVIVTQARPSSFVKSRYGIRYFWEEHPNPDYPLEEDLSYGQDEDSNPREVDKK